MATQPCQVSESETPLRIEMLGGLRVRCSGQTITRFRTQKAGALLAYLAYFRERAHSREVLIDLLWSEADLDTGRHNLSMALSFLRQALDPLLAPLSSSPEDSFLVADRQVVGLNSAIASTDVADFERGLRLAGKAQGEECRECLAAAVNLYTGELLPGHYEDWIFPEQQRLDELYFQATHQLLTHLQAVGDLEGALEIAHRALSANRLREEAYQEVIRLYAAAGQPAAALRHYRELERILKEELDTAPSPTTLALIARLHSAPASQEQQLSSVPLSPANAAVIVATRESVLPPGQEMLPRSEQLEPVGGAVPLGSKFYITRATDSEFRAALARGDSILVMKGPRQVGKTSLLARGLQQAREAGAQVVLSNFQVLSAADLESSEALLLALAEMLADQLDREETPGQNWNPQISPNLNFQRYLRRRILSTLSTPLVWAMDEADRIFSCAFASEVFGLFRTFHDERVFEPGGPWSRLTLAIVCSTEAHLFIADPNQSPFNVGTRLTLEDFTLEQVADLNRRYGMPIPDDAGLTRYHRLVGGHPYLTRCGLHAMVAHGTSLVALEVRATGEDWIFGQHLRRIRSLLNHDTELRQAVKQVVMDGPGLSAAISEAAFYRLRSAGILSGDAPEDARPRCELYAAYLRRHFASDV